MHPIAGAIFVLYGGQRAARVSESARRAGLHLHCQSAAGSRGWPQFTTYRPGPAAGSRVLSFSGPGRQPYSGAVSRQPHVPQVPSVWSPGPGSTAGEPSDTRGPAGVGY
jgi:hypothetical protein